MTTQSTKQITQHPDDTTIEVTDGPKPKPRAEMASPSPRTTETTTRLRFLDSRWWRWGRGVFAALLVLALIDQWAGGGAATLVILGPMVVVVATVIQRIVAKIRGELVGFAADPLNPENRPYTMQFVLRGVLAALTIAAAAITLERAAVTDTEYLINFAWVAVPTALFVALQLLPSRTVSRALNGVAVVAAAFLAFQLVQVHFRSGLDDAVSMVAPFEDGDWVVASGGRSTLVNHHYALPHPQQQYAVDFVVDHDGRTFEGDADDPASYHAWDEALLAPADGVVVEVEQDLRDWPVGEREADIENAPGNYVVLDIGDGHYVVLAHLRQGSATVAEGDRVVAGEIVGRVGNSGNTAQPHLHMQVQDSPEVSTELFGSIDSFPMHFTNITHIRGGTDHPEQQDQMRRNDIIRVEG